ncbi:efflux RND transporter periplasmic adaptor subunit [Uliginosibacterium sp. H3]|uniref:Efflux RND transporter periplasmic adaptor subunit n=1 Tax=Uliginosibacterium silvisoli TaxID=3114758 RepID=A0ABU6K0N6_9RHOO|nr:efflux RND transporter periplasmic adaptor subunit [Uliginosibacterium sp. H3]
MALALCVMALAACGKKDAPAGSATAEQSAPKADKAAAGGNAGRGNRPTAVSVTTTRLESVTLSLEAQGNVIALDDLEIRPQKNGTVKQIHFKEGDELKRGQLMFTLDDRDDVANVARLEATVLGTAALVSAAERDLARSKDLAERNFASTAAVDASRDKLDAANALLSQNKAAVEQARVSLSYTYIRAPFDGRAGVIGVRPGSLVTSNATSTAMVKITRMNPIGVTFALPERDLPILLAGQRQGPMKVSVDLDTSHRLKGEVTFIDSAVDRTSGTILVKAKLENDERRVWPGQYVTVKIVAGEVKDAVVLPSQAIVNGPNGRLVYVVKEDETVAAQPVDLVRIIDEKAVLKGIGPGVKVVLEGGQNLRPGGKVQEVKSDDGKGGGRRGGGRRNGDQSAPQAGGESAPAANGDKRWQDAGKESAKAPVKEAGKDKPAGKTGAATVAANDKLPEGFTPRDPEAWAQMDDTRRAEIIQRWRERKAAGAGTQ